MNTGVLTLYFSETVDVSTFDITGITLQRDTGVTDPLLSHALTSGEILVDDAPTVLIEITNDDLNILKTLQIDHTNMSTWLSLRNGAVLDILMQPVCEITNNFAKPVRDYTPDTTPPLLRTVL